MKKNDSGLIRKNSPVIRELLEKHPAYFGELLKQLNRRNIQIIYTQIDRDENNNPRFTDHTFYPDSIQYFYPASTVKLPTAILALQKLNELGIEGVDRQAAMITEADYSGQTPTFNDPQSDDGRPTVANYIRKIFLVSDNDAFNRLYEFLGQQYLNIELHKRGYDSAQIIHRLEISLSPGENRHTNPVKFLDGMGNILYSQPLQNNQQAFFAERNEKLGEAYYKNGELIKMPMDFSLKNRLSLSDLHHILRSVMFPDNVPENQRFNLTTDDYNFLYRYMSAMPSESIHPSYDAENYWDAYVKFLLFGSEKKRVPPSIRIFNKVGDAYGQLIDAAYIVDFKNNVEFFLSAAINCNTNNILNDDVYDYDTIGLPFMKHLGEVIYQYELQRERTVVPDLSNFAIDYSKAY
ncbi:hypothetical protein BH20BAC1_BH20BAC1_10400 [soil metagenome]